MDLMHFYTLAFLCLSIFIGQLSQVIAKPTNEGNVVPLDRFNYDYYQPYSAPLTEQRLRRLRRGYYYIDDGYISAVPESSIRRQDSATTRGSVEYSPLVKYKHIRTKRKKLFVPNLFG